MSLLRKLPGPRNHTPIISQMLTRKRAEGMPWVRPTLIRVVRECPEEMTLEPKSKRSREELIR